MPEITGIRAFLSSSPTYGLDATFERIRKQELLLASMTPGSAAHRTATETLLILRDSAHVMMEARDMIRSARLASKKAGGANLDDRSRSGQLLDRATPT